MQIVLLLLLLLTQSRERWVELTIDTPNGTMYYATSVFDGETPAEASWRLLYVARRHLCMKVPIVTPCGRKHGKVPPDLSDPLGRPFGPPPPPPPRVDPGMIGPPAPVAGYTHLEFLPPI